MEYPFKDLLPLDEVLAREGYYKDWTHLDPEVFYSLTQISNFIKTKGYGVDVRLLIAQLAEHFGLKTTQVVDLGNLLTAKHATLKTQFEQAVSQVNTDRNALETQFNQSVAQMEADKNTIIANATVDSEVILARGGKPTLGARLDETTAKLAQKANQAFVDAQLSTIVSGAPKGTYTDLAALQSAYPNGAEGIFLVLQNGHWYYWNSATSAWSDGGVYQGTGIADNAIRPSMLYDPNFIKRESVNRFDKTTALQGYATSPTGKSVSVNWYTTDYFIPVNPGDVIRAKPAYGGTIYSYDSNKSYITNRSPTTNNEPISYTIPPIGGFIKFNVFKDNINAFMYTINKPLPDIYEPFVASDVITVDWLDVKNNSITPSKIPPETIAFLQDELDSQTLTSKWHGKKMITPGTSISFQDGKPYAQGPQQGQIAKGWQTHAKEQLGLASVTNIALSGRPMADSSTNGTGMITGILARTDYINYDLCVIEEGTNDAKLNVPAGVIKTPGSSDFDRTTFCGSMQMGIEHIKLYNPNITLVLFTPLHRNNGGLNSFDSVNSVGLKLSDYRDLIIKIGALYGCKVVDMFAESGISMITLATDTIDGLHPNDDGGYVKMGNTAVIGINNT